MLKKLRGTEGLSVHLVEISPEFSRIQAEKLCQSSSVERWSSSASETHLEKETSGRNYTIEKSSQDGKSPGRFVDTY